MMPFQVLKLTDEINGSLFTFVKTYKDSSNILVMPYKTVKSNPPTIGRLVQGS